jgi:hypothetical protein
MRALHATLAASASLPLLAAQSLELFGGTSPSLASPCSVLLFALALLGAPLALVLAAPVLLFWGTCPPLFRGEAAVPTRFVVLLCLAVATSATWYARGWSFGLRFQGALFTAGCAALSVCMLGGVGLLLRRTRARPSFATALATQSLFFAWLVTYAFPYLGEAP